MLGKIKGKAGISIAVMIKTIILMTVSIVFGLFLVVISVNNKNLDFLLWIGILLMSSSLIYFLLLKQEENLAGKFVFYENGFEDEIGKNRIFYENVKSYFYFVSRNGAEKVRYLVIEIEKRNNLTEENNFGNKNYFERIVINSKLNGRAVGLFVKNYIEATVENEIFEIENDDKILEFRIFEEKKALKEQALSPNIEKNLEKLEISGFLKIDKNGIFVERGNVRVKNENFLKQKNGNSEFYGWEKIKKVWIDETKKLQILGNDEELIFEKDVNFLERVELILKICECFLEK